MISVLSLNIEGDNHFEKWIPWVNESKPDVVCLYEVFEVDVPDIVYQLGFDQDWWLFSPMDVFSEDKFNLAAKGVRGILILSRISPQQSGHEFYKGSVDNIPELIDPKDSSRVLNWVTLEKDSQQFTVAMTHFTWAANGGTNNDQARDLVQLKKVLDSFSDFILVGDLNSPRGGVVWTQLAEWYQDTIPQKVITTMDTEIHRVGTKLPDLVVDGCFITPEYQAEEVVVQSGVSDHMGVLATINRKNHSNMDE